MSEANIAVVGAQGVGKSTFIQKAFGLRDRPAEAVQLLRPQVSGAPIPLRLFEIDLDHIDVADDGSIIWPKRLDGTAMPNSMDGVLTLYDVTESDSLESVPSILDGLMKAAVPTFLVACKCDAPTSEREVNPDSIEQHKAIRNRIRCYRTSALEPESQRDALFSLIRGILSSSSERIRSPPARPRTNSVSQAEIPSRLRQQSSQGRRSSHSGTNAPITVPVFMSSSNLDQPTTPNSRNSHSNGSRPPNIRSLSDRSVNRRQETRSSRAGEWAGSAEIKSAGLGLEVVTDIPFQNGKVVDTFLNMEDEPEDPYPDGDEGETPLLDRKDNESIVEQPVKVGGCSFEELVDRLLAQPMSKSDAKFGLIFLCLYRKFATPRDLIESMIRRFHQLEEYESSYMTKISSQLRLVGILVQWTTDYPGDFGNASARSQLAHFINRLSTNRVFAMSAKDVRLTLENGMEDEDGIWAKQDDSRNEYHDDDFLSANSSIRSSTATLSAITGSDDLERQYSETSTETDDGENLYHSPTTPSGTRSSGNNTILSASSSQTIPSSIAAAERLAQSMVPSPRMQLSKLQWHSFIDNSDEDIATELTRIDWTMFCAIRPRDLIRHVSLPTEKKDHLKSVENVNRMINHFNHVAYWVANMIILRDKPKHRALALEKFMNIAWKLRYRNNYNSLGAVIAGINGSAVHRLTQTRELVDHKVLKQFMRLEILMGTQRSHFAYRLAWENTPSERIPFLPLHRRDLVSAEQGNRTYFGDSKDRINWRKFEVMGDVIVGLQRSRTIPYTDLVPNNDVRRLILECAFLKDDDALYERSILLEVPGAGSSDPSKKKFPWFQR